MQTSNETESSLTEIVSPVLFPQWQVKMSAVNNVWIRVTNLSIITDHKSTIMLLNCFSTCYIWHHSEPTSSNVSSCLKSQLSERLRTWLIVICSHYHCNLGVSRFSRTSNWFLFFFKIIIQFESPSFLCFVFFLLHRRLCHF